MARLALLLALCLLLPALAATPAAAEGPEPSTSSCDPWEVSHEAPYVRPDPDGCAVALVDEVVEAIWPFH